MGRVTVRQGHCVVHADAADVAAVLASMAEVACPGKDQHQQPPDAFIGNIFKAASRIRDLISSETPVRSTRDAVRALRHRSAPSGLLRRARTALECADFLRHVQAGGSTEVLLQNITRRQSYLLGLVQSKKVYFVNHPGPGRDA